MLSLDLKLTYYMINSRIHMFHCYRIMSVQLSENLFSVAEPGLWR